MTISEIKEILKGKFAEEEDRKYWLEKLKKAEIREQTAKENQKYFREYENYKRKAK